MTRQKFAIGAVAVGFALSAVPVWAQRPEGGGDRGRPAGSGSTGSAVSRPSGDGGGHSGGSTASSGSSGSSSSSSSSDGGGATYAPAPSRSEAARERAPQHPRSQPRAGGGDRSRGGESSGRAVPRGTAPSGGDTTSSSSSSSDGERTRDRTESSRERAVPTYSRPRDGRPVTGHATGRSTPIPDRDGDRGYYYSRYPRGYYYDPYSSYGNYWYPGYSLGLGYFYYDPYWYGGYGGSGYGYPGYGYQGYGSGQYAYGEAGALRLKIKPRDAQVFVDGYFVGNVDSFDGVFQRLNVEAGSHKLEIRAPGYETLQFDVLITPGDTVTYKGDLERIK